ncbi:MAG: DUF2892 domain-containing protein [Patescibacteria group bacterium]|jgi:VIT1/CCC1 family predicted Fe2+/Mn2+ transporter|nr:DUF2892 domain-containing protein [Patescibacteria group bacterium]
MEDKKSKIYRQSVERWYLERIAFLIAGIFVSVSAVLFLLGVSFLIWFILFVGLMLINFALTGYCPMAILLSKIGFKKK